MRRPEANFNLRASARGIQRESGKGGGDAGSAPGSRADARFYARTRGGREISRASAATLSTAFCTGQSERRAAVAPRSG